MADPGQLENALLNLLINARDAMPHGGKLIIACSSVSLDDGNEGPKLDVDSGDYVVLAVSDTGHGMPASVSDQVFDPFFTTKDVGEGSGLGLSMVYGFARQSGGVASIYSEEGRGTTVKIYLPVATSMVQATPPGGRMKSRTATVK
jgi:signal transduction histidine kinase